jgi:tetratricopeptide (TPR) repeat protein
MKKSSNRGGRNSQATKSLTSGKAASMGQSAQALDGSNAEFVNQLKKAQVLLDRGQAAQAYRLLQDLGAGTGDADTNRFLALTRLTTIAAFQAGFPQEAYGLALAGLTHCPDGLDFNLYAAVTAAAHKEYKAAALHAENFLALCETKNTAEGLGLWDDSYAHRQQLLNAYAVALLELNEHQRAEKILLEAIEIDPRYDSSYINLAILYDHTGRHKEASKIIAAGRAQIADSTELNEYADKFDGKATISVCLMVKNEEEFLGRCLSAIQDLADEIIVVDTGSQDRTLEIAQQFGCKIHHFPWTGDFSAARNETLRHATMDWIFVIDADEEVPAGEAPKIRSLINQPDIDLASISVYNKSLETGAISSFLPSIRLFRRRLGLSYFGIVHNRLKVPQDLVSARSDVRLFHYGYDLSRDRLAAKQARTKALLDKQLMEKPDDIYANFNMAQLLRGLQGGNGPAISHQIITHAMRVARQQSAQQEGYRGQWLMSLHQLASAHLNLKEYTLSERFCQEALQAKPDYLDPLLTLGHIYLATNKLGEASRCYQRFLDAVAAYDPGKETDNIILLFLDEKYNAHYGLAVIAEKEGRIDDAIRQYNMTLENRSPYLDVFCRLGKLYLDKGDQPRALQMFTLESQRDSESPLAWFGMGEAAAMAGDNVEALAHFRTAAALAPTNHDIVFRLGRLYIQAGQTEKGFEALQKAVWLAPHLPELPFLGGNLAFEAGRYERAAEFYRQALDCRPDYSDARNNLGNCYFRLGRHDDACAEYEQVLRLTPNHRLAWRNLGLAYSLSGALEKAEGALSRYCRIMSDDAEALRFLGDIYMALSRFHDAIEAYGKYIADHPQDYTCLYNISEAYLALGFTGSALAGYHGVLAMAPEYGPAKERIAALTTPELAEC